MAGLVALLQPQPHPRMRAAESNAMSPQASMAASMASLRRFRLRNQECYLLLTSYFLLLTTYYLLLATYYLLLTTYYLLLTNY